MTPSTTTSPPMAIMINIAANRTDTVTMLRHRNSQRRVCIVPALVGWEAAAGAATTGIEATGASLRNLPPHRLRSLAPLPACQGCLLGRSIGPLPEMGGRVYGSLVFHDDIYCIMGDCKGGDGPSHAEFTRSTRRRESARDENVCPFFRYQPRKSVKAGWVRMRRVLSA